VKLASVKQEMYLKHKGPKGPIVAFISYINQVVYREGNKELGVVNLCESCLLCAMKVYNQARTCSFKIGNRRFARRKMLVGRDL
jgi:hypothetical protein